MGIADEVMKMVSDDFKKSATEVSSMFIFMCKQLKEEPFEQATFLAATLSALKIHALHPDVDCAVSFQGVVLRSDENEEAADYCE